MAKRKWWRFISTSFGWVREGVNAVLSAQILWLLLKLPQIFSSHTTNCEQKTTLAADKFFVGRIMKMVLSTQKMCLVCWGQLKSHFRPTNLCSLKMCPQIFEVTQFSLSTEIFCGLGTAALKWRKSHPTYSNNRWLTLTWYSWGTITVA